MIIENEYTLTEIAKRYPTDKATHDKFTEHYQFHFDKFRNQEIKLLEIGVGGYTNPNEGGGSLKMWKDFFENGEIFSFDIIDKTHLSEPRITVFQGNQVDNNFLSNLVNQTGPLDIIVDDGSHLNSHVIRTFNYLFNYLKTGGIYVVEDTQTSYWKSMGGDYQNPSNLDTTMNYFKSLADGLNHREYIHPGYEPSYLDLNISSIHFYHNLIFIYKGDNSHQSNIIIDNTGNSWAY